MAWTSPKTWTVGEVLTAAGLNEQLRDNLKAMHRLAIATKGAFASGGYNYITALTASRDDFSAEFGTGYGWGASGDAFVAPEAGTYLAVLFGLWAGATGGLAGNSGVRIDYMNSGGSLLGTVAGTEFALINGMATCSVVLPLSASEQLRPAGCTLATGSGGAMAVRMAVQQIG